ncbi:MAG: DNA alkylation repair protein [Candidatus Woesearchaeota archaeon]
MELKSYTREDKREVLQRFFKTGRGEYGEGDLFLGITVPDVRRVAKAHRGLILKDIQELLENKYHEVRLCGFLILVEKYLDLKKKKDFENTEKIVKFYIKNLNRANNWDLIDLSTYKILGDYLLEQKVKRQILFKLIKSNNMWRRRAGIVSTLALIKAGETDEIYALTKQLLNDREDLMHKACGWMMREAGKRDKKKLQEFIAENGKKMPRVMLRYAIEKFEAKERLKILKETTKK